MKAMPKPTSASQGAHKWPSLASDCGGGHSSSEAASVGSGPSRWPRKDQAGIQLEPSSVPA